MSNNINTLLQDINYARRRNLKEKRSESEKKENANLMNEYLREINRKRKPLSAAAQPWTPPSTLSANAAEWHPPANTRNQRKHRKQSRKSRKARKTRRASRR